MATLNPVNVTRNLNDWEVREYVELLQILATQRINSNRDHVKWKLENDGEFSVRSYYKHIMREDFGRSHCFPAF